MRYHLFRNLFFSVGSYRVDSEREVQALILGLFRSVVYFFVPVNKLTLTLNR